MNIFGTDNVTVSDDVRDDRPVLVGGFEIRIIASDAIPPDTVMMVSPGISPEGEVEARRRIRAGEDPVRVEAEILAREGRAVLAKVGP